jgi:hypothetical protein
VETESVEFSFAGEDSAPHDQLHHLLEEELRQGNFLFAVRVFRSSLPSALSAAKWPGVITRETIDDARLKEIAKLCIRGEELIIGLDADLSSTGRKLTEHGYREAGRSELLAGAKHEPVLGCKTSEFREALGVAQKMGATTLLYPAHDADPVFLFVDQRLSRR